VRLTCEPTRSYLITMEITPSDAQIIIDHLDDSEHLPISPVRELKEALQRVAGRPTGERS